MSLLLPVYYTSVFRPLQVYIKKNCLVSFPALNTTARYQLRLCHAGGFVKNAVVAITPAPKRTGGIITLTFN